MNLAARRTLRLRLRDLAAASAFTAVALSGALPLPVTALFVVAFGLSLAGRRPLADQRGLAVLVLLLVGAALFGLVYRGAMDLVVAAVSFASLVTAHRLVSSPSPGTDQQVLLSSLLLVAGAAALSGEIWFAACLLGFGVFSCLHLGLSVVEGPVERDEELPMAPVFRQVSVGVALALAGGLAFFFVFPRLSWNLASRRATPGLLGGSTGMSDRVRLGGGGNIKTSARVVLKASLEPDPGTERLDKYWIGRRFDRFDGREWRGSGVDGEPARGVHLANVARPVVQRIELLPAYGSRTLVALAHPATFTSPVAITAGGSTPTALINSVGEEVRFATDALAYSYTATSVAGTWLRDDAEERARAVTLPAVDPRVGALARQVVGSEQRPRQRAQKLEDYLKAGYGYTLELEGDVADPLADFLFVRKKGHCEHFATALAVLLRTLDVPARVTVGFFGGERVGARYVVRAGDAHAWVEVWVEEEGWVTFDATPSEGRSGQPTAVLAQLADALDRLEEFWRSRVIDYSFTDQLQFARQLVRPPRGASSRDDDEPPTGRREGLPRRAAAAAGAMALTALAWGLLSRRRAARPHPAASFLAKLEQRLDQAHIVREAHESIEALARRLEVAQHPSASAVGRATRRYLEARFGARPLGAAEARTLLDAVHRGARPK
jgi:transglutaminase-like putative cysteine protease